ncbi:MAG: hypothetical protein U0353_15810 [Sandaracinus sp.]
MDPRNHDHLSAALRHLRDAEHLFEPGQPWHSADQAYHLAGFAPECARKATLSVAGFDQAIGHGISEASELALAVALTLDPRSQRYRTSNLAAHHPALEAWSENCRYERTGTRPDPEVTAILADARAVVDSIASALWMDGVVPAGFEW